MRTNYPRHLECFSYQGFHQYSLTFCTHERRHAFADEENVDAAIAQIRRAAADERFAILAYCVMPDHVHLLVEGLEESSDLKEFVSRAKQFSGYEHAQRTGQRLWQRYCFEHVVRDYESIRRQIAYILLNPVRKQLAQDPADYPFIGSTVYTRDELLTFAFGGRQEESGR